MFLSVLLACVGRLFGIAKWIDHNAWQQNRFDNCGDQISLLTIASPKEFLGDFAVHNHMRNNLIAIVAISFVTVGALWGVGNLLNPYEEPETANVEGVLLIAQRSTFNATNPDVHVVVGVPTKLVVRNEDAVTHDFKIDEAKNGGITPVNTAPLRGGQDFLTAIVAKAPGSYEYYCSYHQEMRGKIIAR
jgi:plastocyanin